MSLAEAIYQDLLENAISEINYGEEFNLSIKDHTSAVAGVEQSALNELPFTGYYGTSAKHELTIKFASCPTPAVADSFAVPLSSDWSPARRK